MPELLKGPPSTRRDDLALLRRWRVNREQAARDILVIRYMPLARRLARRYGRSTAPMDDLVQVASFGLLKAIERFDPQRGSTLKSFAIPTILGELRRYFRDCGWGVHVPRGTQERALAVRETADLLAGELGRSPTVNQIAEYLELDTEQVLDGFEAMTAFETAPLDAPAQGQDDTLLETLGSIDHGFALVEDLATLGVALEHLERRDQEILRLRFFGELTQSEIAERVGVSQMQVSRRLRCSLQLLRDEIATDTQPSSSQAPQDSAADATHRG